MKSIVLWFSPKKILEMLVSSPRFWSSLGDRSNHTNFDTILQQIKAIFPCAGTSSRESQGGSWPPWPPPWIRHCDNARASWACDSRATSYYFNTCAQINNRHTQCTVTTYDHRVSPSDMKTSSTIISYDSWDPEVSHDGRQTSYEGRAMSFDFNGTHFTLHRGFNRKPSFSHIRSVGLRL